MIDYNKLEQNYNRNINFIKTNIPELYEKVNNSTLDKFELIEEADELNILVNGYPLYPKEKSKLIDIQLNEFMNKEPTIFQDKPVFYPEERRYTEPLNNGLQLRIQSKSKVYDLEKNLNYFKGYKNLDNNIPAMILFGIGDASVILKLIDRADIDHLYIIDYDFSFFKLSLHLTDWIKIFEYFLDKERTLMILDVNTSKKIEVSMALIINDLYKYNPMYCFNLNYLTHYSHESFNEVKKKLKKNLARSFEGWGFIDDNINSINHSIINYKKKKDIFTKIDNKTLFSDLNIFIIANGPSLDEDIEVIKKNKQNAVILSCGTALKSLVVNNIIPDFHFEIERDINVYDALVSSHIEEFLKDNITLIGLNVLHPKVIDLFKESLIILRDNDAGASILDDKYFRFKYTNPSVSNGAFDFALNLNPKNIFLFGLDLGSANENKHHSKSSDYGKEGSYLENAFVKFTKIDKGNFRDKIYTDSYYEWTKLRIENCMIINENIVTTKVYNCSDGLYIRNATPLKSKDIVISSIENKKSYIKEIKSFFKKLSNLEDKDRLAVLDRNISHLYLIKEKVSLKIDEYLEKKSKDIKIFSILDNIMQILNNIDNIYHISKAMVHGTLKISISMMYTHILAMNKINKDYSQFIDNGLLCIKDFFPIAINELEQIRLES